MWIDMHVYVQESLPGARLGRRESAEVFGTTPREAESSSPRSLPLPFSGTTTLTTFPDKEKRKRKRKESSPKKVAGCHERERARLSDEGMHGTSYPGERVYVQKERELTPGERGRETRLARIQRATEELGMFVYIH